MVKWDGILLNSHMGIKPIRKHKQNSQQMGNGFDGSQGNKEWSRVEANQAWGYLFFLIFNSFFWVFGKQKLGLLILYSFTHSTFRSRSFIHNQFGFRRFLAIARNWGLFIYFVPSCYSHSVTTNLDLYFLCKETNKNVDLRSPY